MKTIIDFTNKVKSLVDGRMSNIANVETSPSTHPYAVGKQLIFNGLLCKATSAIAVGDTLAVGTNLALADNVVEQIYSLNQGLTNSLANLSHENLLDNPWFTVNQRGQSSYTNTWSYTLDRWKLSVLSEVNVVDDGVQLVRGSSSDVNSGTLVQKIEENVVKLLDGKTITISALLSNGALVTNTGTFVYKGGYFQLSKTSNGTTISITSNSKGTENSFRVSCADKNSNITVRAIKLELGSVSTLAMDTAPNYQQELAKCQRYFVRFGSNESVPAYTYNFGMAYEVNSSSAYFNVMIPIPMRSTPLISYQGSWAIGSKALNNITVNSMINNIVKLVCTTSQTFTAGEIELLENKEAGINYIDFSADL